MRILFLNLPPRKPKKADNELYWLQASMNLGLLAVASSASRSGHVVSVCDWLGPQQCEIESTLPETLRDFAPDVVALSVPSGYGEEYLDVATRIAKQVVPRVTTIAGGQYQVGKRPMQVLARYPALDAVAIGEGERLDWTALHSGDSTVGVTTRHRAFTIPGKSTSGKENSNFLDFSLYKFNIREYAPSIEVGRGCPFTCSFCSLSGAPSGVTAGTVDSIRFQLTQWLDIWPNRVVPIYFECPVFFCTPDTLPQWEECLLPFSSRVEWRVQARVDSIAPKVLRRLKELGLAVIDLGLESASPRMLQLMRKTRDAKRYLERARRFLEEAGNCGIKTKVNVLLYPGESDESVAETESFLLDNRQYIYGISAGTAIEFPGSDLSQELPTLSKKYGASRLREPELESAGVFPLHLSDAWSFQRGREWCLRMSRELMTAKSYYRLKSVGYYSPTVSYEDFLSIAALCAPASLPFSWAGDLSCERGSSRLATVSDVVEWDRLR